MHSFFLTMLLYPEVQSRARRELEAVLGTHRLPTFEDFGSVPYIDALIKELLRWQLIVRLGKSLRCSYWVDTHLPVFTMFEPADLPRKLREDDVYNGYHLQKDSLVIVNIW